MEHFLSLLNLLKYCLCFILAPRPEIKPTCPALEGEVLTTELPGKCLHNAFYFKNSIVFSNLQGFFVCVCFFFLMGIEQL